MCTRDRERGRRIVGVYTCVYVCARAVNADRMYVRRDEEAAGEGEERYAGAREYVTGMARGQLTFIILTLMDYLIPYIPTDPSLASPRRSPSPPPTLRLQAPSSVLDEVQDNIHGCIRANATKESAVVITAPSFAKVTSRASH